MLNWLGISRGLFILLTFMRGITKRVKILGGVKILAGVNSLTLQPAESFWVSRRIVSHFFCRIKEGRGKGYKVIITFLNIKLDLR